MKPYNEEKLKKAQEASLKIMLEVDRICRKHGLQYMLDSGTLLGAVRHQGFIPWDDDADLAMTRENFEAFRKVAAEELPETMQLVLPWEYRRGMAFYDFVPRVIYLPSRRHQEDEETAFYEEKLNHLWVDIFILDHLPDKDGEASFVRFRQKCLYGLSMPRRYNVDFSKYSFLDKARVGFLGSLSMWFSMPGLYLRQERLSKKYNGKHTSRLYYSNYQPDFIDDSIDRAWIEPLTELSFEGHRFMAPNDYDKVLRTVYGDYMQLPPEEQRVPSHSDDIEVYE